MEARFLAQVLITIAVCAPAAFGQSNASGASNEIATITGAILEADGPKAVKALSSLSEAHLDVGDRTFRACALSRLLSEPHGAAIASPLTHQPDTLAGGALDIYESYWRDAVMHPAEKAAAEENLQTRLGRLLHLHPTASMDMTEEELARELQARGFQSLEGRTGFLREFMLWGKQEEKTYSVKLPESVNRTRVVFMDGFYSQGWASYLTCGRSGTGGWTKPDGLFVVVPAYSSFTDENFRVNFLAHESQHYADHKVFPDLKPWELEYRAKLVELAYANDTMSRVILRFSSDQGDDPASPHSYADKRVLAAIRQRLGLTIGADLTKIPTPNINGAAVAELLADSARRRAKPQ
jgi:hypothetical protein